MLGDRGLKRPRPKLGCSATEEGGKGGGEKEEECEGLGLSRGVV
jgi:hypothetical protein